MKEMKTSKGYGYLVENEKDARNLLFVVPCSSAYNSRAAIFANGEAAKVSWRQGIRKTEYSGESEIYAELAIEHGCSRYRFDAENDPNWFERAVARLARIASEAVRTA